VFLGGALKILAAAAFALDAPSQVQLGARLFQDQQLSSDGRVSCATCHDPSHAFTDGRPVAVGVYGRAGTRNSPSLLDADLHAAFAWDGRRRSIDDQIHDALLSPAELGLRDDEQLQERLGVLSGESPAEDASRLTPAEAVAALAAYVRSLSTEPSAFDRYLAGQTDALSAAEHRGFSLFRGRARCSGCHVIAGERPSLTDQAFHPVDIENPSLRENLSSIALKLAEIPAAERFAQVPLDARVAALGRFIVTLNPRDISAFRTPSLRSVAVTAPYFHDGSVVSLDAAVDREIYYRNNERPLVLNPAERADLVAFLQSLTSPPSHVRSP
jgi:cytochrome c peroxidase